MKNTRQIKFRALVKSAKTIRIYDDVGFLNGCVLNKKGEVINKAILMQFTGLLDKNGKEIYEGDIVSFVFRTSKEEIIMAKIIFRNGTFGYLQDNSIKKHIYIYEFWPLSQGKAETIEIIGNVWENEDLLKN